MDTQITLAFSTPDEVPQEVLRRCEVFGRGGGFVFSAIHNIHAKHAGREHRGHGRGREEIQRPQELKLYLLIITTVWFNSGAVAG